MTTQLVENKCDGGHWTCSPPKQCCLQGCCFIFSPSSIYKGSPSSTQHGTVLNPLFLGHWYFWLAVTATVAGILCACSLWRKHSQGNLCCKDAGRDDRASEPDSNSCYAPPQYSRCNSFHQAPPPYSEVTSKPDLYPLVISYNAEPVIKNNNGSTGYLMVQYFRNFIVRPAGSLSATSTNDSLSSSFLCSAVNEANSLIPPPYSHMGSLEEISTEIQQQTSQPAVEQGNLPRSTSSSSNRDNQQMQQMAASPSPSNYSLVGPFNFVPPTPAHQKPCQRPSLHQMVSIRDNPCFGQEATKIGSGASSNTIMPNVENTRTGSVESKKCQNICDAPAAAPRRSHPHHQLSKDDSESQEDDPNFADLLDLSSAGGCAQQTRTAPQLQLQYSIGSDISSLANAGSPDSPPQATSPTAEMRELLDKIQRLPQPQPQPQPQKSPLRLPQPGRSCFHKVRAKTLYMPLGDEEEGFSRAKHVANVFPKNWLSRSAPCTPCGNFVPNFSIHHLGSQKGSKTKISDGSPLLKEHTEESEEEDRKEDRS